MSKDFPTVHAMLEALQPSYPVFCLRPHVLQALAKRFLTVFPGRVLYAVKCNPHPLVLKTLSDAGIHHFDTASLPEIAQVREAIPDAACYFMHPVKSTAAIASANRVYGIDTYVVDHPRELAKVLKEAGGGEGLTIFVRISTPPAEGTLYHLAAKFGAGIEEAAALLKEAKAHGCQVGLAFHVGSQCLNPDAYRTALSLCGEVLDRAKVNIQGLDVGGGFPAQYLGTNTPALEEYMKAIEDGARALNLRRDCVLMCEPGRALVAHAASLIVQVQLRKGDQLYINDGVYGSLSEVVQAGIHLPVRLWRLNGQTLPKFQTFSLAGPTCDSLDMLPSEYSLPADVEEGDWIEIDRLGAYSNANATRFNGFYTDTWVNVHDEPIGHVA
jgi:ornithine decarboxylase